MSSSDLSAALERIHQLNEAQSSTVIDEIEISDQSEVLDFHSDSEIPSEIETLDIPSFCNAFNQKVGVSATTLSEVLDLIDVLLSDQIASISESPDTEHLKAKNEALKNLNQQLTRQLNEANSKLASKQTEIDDLHFENQKAMAEIASHQQKIEQYEKELEISKDQLLRCQTNKQSFEAAISSLSDLIQSQLDDSPEFMAQRESLINLIHQQNQALQIYENLVIKSAAGPVVEKSYEEEDNDDPDFHTYTVLAHSVSDQIPELSQFIETITENTSLSIDERIESIVNILREDRAALITERQQLSDKDQSLSENLSEMRDRCSRILSLFDEELQFLQNMVNSSDIQNVIYFKTGQSITPEDRAELLKHCASVQKYIEEIVPSLSEHDVAEAFTKFEQISPTTIFELMNSNSLEEKLNQVITNFSSDQLEEHQLFSLLAAQIFINELLQNHAYELRQRFEQQIRENNQIHLDLDHAQSIQQVQEKQIKKLARREAQARKVISKVFEIDQNSKFLQLLGQAAQKFEEMKENSPAISKLREEIRKRDDALVKCEEELADIQNELEEKVNETDQTLDSLKEQISEKDDQLSDKDQKINELNAAIEELQNRIQKIDTLHEEDIAERQKSDSEEKNRTEAVLLANEKEIALLKQKVASNESTIDKLKEKKRELSQRVQYLESMNQKAATVLKEKSQTLRAQYEDSVHSYMTEIERLKAKCVSFERSEKESRVHSEELSTDLNSCKLQLKALSLKLKHAEDKLETQRQTLQTQFSARCKAIESDMYEKMRAENEKRERVIQRKAGEWNSEFQTHLPIDGDFMGFFDSMSEELAKRKRAQDVFEETAGDIERVQRLLNITDTVKIFNGVKQLKDEKEENDKRIKELEKSLSESQNGLQTVQKELKGVENERIALREWELWGRRLHRVVHQTNCSTFSNEQVRQSLEESLLSTTSNRWITQRLESLRTQKAALLKIAGEKAIVPSVEPKRATWQSLISVLIAMRRMQKTAGLIPIDGAGSRNGSSVDGSGVKKGSIRSEKKIKSLKELDSTSSPARRPPPLFLV